MEETTNYLGPVEKIVLLAFILVIGYIVIKNGGCGIVEKTEKIEFIDPPSNGQSGPAVPKQRKEQRDQAVDKDLKRIAESLGQQSKSWPKEEMKTLSKDEEEYLQSLSQKQEFEDQIKNAAEWLQTLKTSLETYQQVKAIFDRNMPDSNDKTTTPDYELIFQDKELANTFFQELESFFGIPADQAKEFAQKGYVSVKDWAQHVSSTPNRVSSE